MSRPATHPAPASAANESDAVPEKSQHAGAETYWSPVQEQIDRSDFRILQQTLPSTPGWFVEIGCGWGRLLPAYLRPDREIVLVDSHFGLLELVLQAYPRRNIHCIRADAYRLPFRPDVFAAGLCVRAFQELESPEPFLHEVARILRPQARFVLSYANKRNLLRLLRYGRCCFRHNHEAAGDRIFVTHPGYLERLLQPAGFTRLRSQASGFFEQLLRPGRFLYPAVRALPFLLPLLSLADRLLDVALGPLGLLPHTFLVLRKDSSAAPASPATNGPLDLAQILACPYCRSFPLIQRAPANGYICSVCARHFPRKGGILDFAEPLTGP